MLRTLIFVGIPALAQVPGAPGRAIEDAMRCVHAAMTDPRLPVGVMPEQIAQATLARCFDEIEAAALAGVAGSSLPASRLDAVRAALRKELYEFALLAGSGMREHDFSEGDSAQTRVTREPI